MKYLCRIVFLLLTITILITTVTAQDPYSEAGTAGNVLLRIGLAPRAEAMAGAFTAVANDENTLFYNPAGLANIYRGIISLNHTEWFQDIRIDNIAAVYALNNKLGFGVGVTHLWMPEIEGVDASGNPTSPFRVNNSIITIGTAYKLAPYINAGFNVKYFQENLASFSSSGVGLAFGLLAFHLWESLSAGLLIDNLGAQIKYDQEKQRLPLTYRLGLAYKFTFPDLWLALDADKSIDTPVNLHLGVEYEYQNLIALRLGNKFMADELLNPAFGVGFNINQQYYINYTFINYSDLGVTHRIGFSFNFNTPASHSGTVIARPLPKELKVAIPPATVTIEIIGEELVIRWDEVRGATYNVYARHASKTEWTRLNKNPLSLAEIKYKKPTVSGEYLFRVSSIINDKESSYSRVVSIEIK